MSDFINNFWSIYVAGISLVSIVACAALTLAPLSRRKRVEVAVQSTRREDLAASESGRFDPLDEAAGALDPSDTDTAQNAVVPELTHPEERP